MHTIRSQPAKLRVIFLDTFHFTPTEQYETHTIFRGVARILEIVSKVTVACENFGTVSHAH